MKKLFPFVVSFIFSSSAFGQLEFLPVGANIYNRVECFGDTMFYSATVTNLGDTVIQGKSCRKMSNFIQWICDDTPFANTLVHQDGPKVYRFDVVDQEFHLMLDYSKQVGESWKVKVCDLWFGTDSVTITVNEISGYSRKVTVAPIGNPGWGPHSLTLLEGVGGGNFAGQYFLLVSPLILTECTSALICYEDPTVGIIHSIPPGCISAVEGLNISQMGDMKIHPNPSSSQSTLEYFLPLSKKGKVIIFDSLGRQIDRYDVPGGDGSLILPEYPKGLYFAVLSVEGQVVGQGKFIRL